MTNFGPFDVVASHSIWLTCRNVQSNTQDLRGPRIKDLDLPRYAEKVKGSLTRIYDHKKHHTID